MTANTAWEELEIRVEARFVLWALRCCAHRPQDSTNAVTQELARGFELADATETLGRFWRFAQTLCGASESAVDWHHPSCDCVSLFEMQVLEALSLVATPGWSVPRWVALVGPEAAPQVDALARHWLSDLRRAGIGYPAPGELVRAGNAVAYAGLPVPPLRH